MEKRQLWQGPKLRTDEEQGLDWKVTWRELFYDLVLLSKYWAELAHSWWVR